MATRTSTAGSVSTRLLLDEMFHPRIAVELTIRGHDCDTVAVDPDLRESSDSDLIDHALAGDRALFNENVADFERLRRHRTAAGEAMPPLIYTSHDAFRRDRRFVGRLTTALDHACASDAATAAGGVLWLRP